MADLTEECSLVPNSTDERRDESASEDTKRITEITSAAITKLKNNLQTAVWCQISLPDVIFKRPINQTVLLHFCSIYK